MIKVRRGLDLPIAGAPEQIIHDGPKISQVAIVGSDYPGMKPTMAVREGDRVTRGQVLFSDKKNPGVVFTAPAAGKVVAVNRGERRVFQSLVIDVSGVKAEKFKSYKPAQLETLDRAAVVENLVNSGQWVALRTQTLFKGPLQLIPHQLRSLSLPWIPIHWRQIRPWSLPSAVKILPMV